MSKVAGDTRRFFTRDNGSGDAPAIFGQPLLDVHFGQRGHKLSRRQFLANAAIAASLRAWREIRPGVVYRVVTGPDANP
ncbi:MAG TPA: hypothetical protein VFJ46_05770 [Xanthobacteraceae bacterium]|nr:hypothetical protein [Xanthobacteraceae bacterium]